MEKTQEEQRILLIDHLKAENPIYKKVPTPADEQGQKDLLRSLMNVREARSVSGEFLSIQDAYLRRESIIKGIVDVESIPACAGDPRLSIWQGDITRLKADAIVNAANSQMQGCFIPLHGCIDNCIHSYAGVQLRLECADRMRQMRLEHGDDYDQPTAVPMLTDAYNLPAKKVIHIVGPIVQFGLTAELEKDLADCYKNTLDLCLENGLRNVAFCCISTGVFRFPNQRAAEIAVETVSKWLAEHDGAIDRVVFNVWKDTDREIYRELLG
ncbi:MAG: protein-ADP-ribose hydrolase [Clostridiales bacterium]|nr:protein-ADP-ribose hydrolase [Clostridiales bacterium]